jgi:hypothetical protein
MCPVGAVGAGTMNRSHAKPQRRKGVWAKLLVNAKRFDSLIRSVSFQSETQYTAKQELLCAFAALREPFLDLAKRRCPDGRPRNDKRIARKAAEAQRISAAIMLD